MTGTGCKLPDSLLDDSPTMIISDINDWTRLCLNE